MQLLQCINFALTNGESKQLDDDALRDDEDESGKFVFAFMPSIKRAASSYALAAFFAVSNVPNQILVFLHLHKLENGTWLIAFHFHDEN